MLHLYLESMLPHVRVSVRAQCNSFNQLITGQSRLQSLGFFCVFHIIVIRQAVGFHIQVLSPVTVFLDPGGRCPQANLLGHLSLSW